MADEIRLPPTFDGRHTALALISAALIASLPEDRAQRFRRILDELRGHAREGEQPLVDIVLKVAEGANQTPEGARPDR